MGIISSLFAKSRSAPSTPPRAGVQLPIEQINKQGYYVSTAIADQLLLELDRLHGHNQTVQRKREFYNKIKNTYVVGACIIGALFFFVPGLFGGMARLVPFFAYLAVLFIGGFLLFEQIANRFQVLTFPTYRYELAKSAIAILGRDMDNYSMISLSLSLKADNYPNHTAVHPRKPSWRIESFCDRFLKLDGKFQDGTIFSIKFQERMRGKKGRNINGKSRLKLSNQGMEILINLRVQNSVYGSLSKFDSLFSDRLHSVNTHRLLNFPMGNIKKLKFKNKNLTLVVRIPDATPLRWAGSAGSNSLNPIRGTGLQMNELKKVQQTFVTALLSCYQILNLSRILKAKEAQ